MTGKNDLEALNGLDVLDQPMSVEVPTRNKTYKLTPTKMGTFKQFAILAIPLVEEGMAAFDSNGKLVELIENHETNLIELIGICTDFTKADYDDMFPDDFMALTLGLIEANMDFFVQNLIPKLGASVAGIKAKVEAAIKKAGLTPSNASSPEATPTKKSRVTR